MKKLLLGGYLGAFSHGVILPLSPGRWGSDSLSGDIVVGMATGEETGLTNGGFP